MGEIFHLVDYIGTFVFAVTGASIAGRAQFDFFGMLFLAFLTAVGGGTVRDLIINETVFWLFDSIYLYIILFATLSTFFLKSFYEKHEAVLFFLDTLGVGTFVVIGTQKALLSELNIESAVIMGTISAVLGGILRSAFSKEHSILYSRELYATVAAIGSLSFVFMKSLNLNLDLSAFITIVICFLVRYLSKMFKIKLPTVKQ